MQLEGFEKKDEDGNLITLNPFDKADKVELMEMDKWIIVSFNRMLNRFEKYLEKYEIGLAIGELEKFFWSYCDDYIEIIKNRVYKPEVYGENARKSGLYAAYHSLLGMVKCFAIYIPHITEEIYQGYFVNYEDAVSVHRTIIEPIPVTTEFTSKDFEVGENTLKIISELRRYKSEKNLSLKAEISSVEITLPSGIELGDSLSDIKATCSCNEITIIEGDELRVNIIE